jgi:hypothetical protein
MKITLIKNTEGVVIGWSMTAESENDFKEIEIIRVINFMGSPKYNGRISMDDSNATKTLSWIEKEYSTDGKTPKQSEPLRYIHNFLKTL